MLNNLNALALKLAPELAARPPHVATFTELNISSEGASVGGVAIDGHMAATMTAPGRVGDGPLILLDDTGEPAVALATLVHELAHILPAIPRAQIEAAPPRPPTTLTLEKIATSELPETEFTLFAHGPNFIRICSHLYVRATAAGCDVDHRTVHGYGAWLSPLERYLPSFAGEAAAYMTSDFKAITALPMPERALHIFAQDESQFRRYLPRPAVQREQPKATAAIAASVKGKVK